MHGDRKPEALPAEALRDHMVIVGYGRVGSHLVNVARELAIPHLVIESDVEKVESLTRHGTPTLWGDAANSEILRYAGLERARAFVTTLPEEAGAEMVVAAARQINPELPIVARAATELGVGRLAELGAQDVIHPELEGGLEIVTRAMLRYGTIVTRSR
jgi:CPA2 family monovalent cation:H+ antiporter-2